MAGLDPATQCYPTPSNQCWPGGVPYLFWNIEMEMFQRPQEITILYLIDHLVRHVRMNEPHPAHVTPSLAGDSVGHYEGDTLVIDTVGIKPGRFAMVDMYGTPHSDALHVVERYRLLDYDATKTAAERDEKDNLRLQDYRNDVAVAVDPDYKGNGLQLEFTVEDEAVFTMLPFRWAALTSAPPPARRRWIESLARECSAAGWPARDRPWRWV